MLKDNKKIKRFVSLDVLRGITVVGMIMVNTQGVGNKFLFLRHSLWDGCRIADLVYPFFLLWEPPFISLLIKQIMN